MYTITFQDQDETPFTDFVFKTIEDAEFFMSFSPTYKLKTKEVPVFSKKFWYTLNPYIGYFDKCGKFLTVRKVDPTSFEELLEKQFCIKDGVRNTSVFFWDATTDIAQAEVLATSIYKGWKTANESQSNVS